jgi:pentapeptide MXKDX repeat protein
VTWKSNLLSAAVACIGVCAVAFMNLALADDSVVTKPDAMSAGHMSSDHMGMMKKPPMKKANTGKSASEPDAMSSDHMAPDAPK